MSYDLYLLPLSPSEDASDAMNRLDEISSRAEEGTRHFEWKMQVAEALMEADSRFRPFQKDYKVIAEHLGISIKEARKRFDDVELNGPGDQKLAQIIIHYSYIVIHWYSGTTPEEMTNYLEILCRETGYAVFDPQESSIMRF